MHRNYARYPVALAALVLVLAAHPAAAAERRDLKESFAWNKGQLVRIDFPVGELHVEATGGDAVEIELRAECRYSGRRCESALEDVRILSRSSDRRLVVEVEGDRNWGRDKLELDATIRVPRQAALDVDMGVGELEISDFESDVRVDMGVGEVTVRAPEAKVRVVNLDAGIGEATLTGVAERVRGRRSLLVGAEVYWDDGPGGARIEVDLGVGDARVRLE